MRINVYSQELTPEVQTIEKKSNTGLIYSAVMLFMHSSPMLHSPDKGQDDDRTAIAFWMPKSRERREQMAQAFESIAKAFRNARVETGLD